MYRLYAYVSIPFIAGQWSLPDAGALVQRLRHMSQSPSLRGSGRFKERAQREAAALLVSIPFIAGQWSLRDDVAVEVEFVPAGSQSPSLRGSGRFGFDS